MALENIFDEEELLCSESIGYGNDLYNSPTYSDDSGFTHGFSFDDILLSDVLPPMTDSIINDVDFDNLRDFNRSDSVSSSNHDHSYSICEPNFTSAQEDKSISKLKYFENQSFKKESLKNGFTQDVIIKEPVETKKFKIEPSQQPELNIDIIKCDDETFSYKDENGKITVVDRSRKNAEMAKINRQRKKRYTSNLEAEVKSLRGRNEKLTHLKNKQESKIKTLQDEVLYLMSVIRNQTKLSSVLRAVSSVPGISIGNSSTTELPPNAEQLSGKTGPDCIEKLEYSGGVCLHVSEDKVSLEFCSNCNKKQS